MLIAAGITAILVIAALSATAWWLWRDRRKLLVDVDYLAYGSDYLAERLAEVREEMDDLEGYCRTITNELIDLESKLALELSEDVMETEGLVHYGLHPDDELYY